MSEFQSDIKDTKYDEDGNELDKHGFRVTVYPDGLETVRKSVANCEQMAGLDRKVVTELLKGEWKECNTYDHTGRFSKKIIIEYDVGTYERTKSDA